MMRWFLIVVIAFALLVPALAGGNVSADSNLKMDVRALPHSIIRINNDTQLEELANVSGWQGNGSTSNPYVIENYVIDAHGNTSAIFIGNVTKYVVIRNCTVYNVTTVQSYGWGSGVMIYRTSNVVVDNLSAYDIVQYGIYIGTDSDSVVVKNSHFYPGNMSYIAGIIVSGSGDILINNTINGSNVGIWINGGYFAKLYSNKMVGSSIQISYSSYADRFDIPANNTVNGKPVLYLTGFGNNQSVDASNAGEVIFGAASWISVHGLNMNDTGSAYLLLGSNNVSIEDSAITNSSTYAVLSQNSQNVVLNNVSITGSGRAAMDIIYSANFTAENITIKGVNSYIYGVYGFGVSGMHFINATVSWASTAIYAYGSSSKDIVVRDSHIYVPPSGYGVYINSGSTSVPIKNVTVENNVFFNSGQDAIHAITVADSLIADNSIFGNNSGSNGIYLAGFSTAVFVEYNTVTGQHTGIDLASAYSNTVTGNRIFNNSYTGISMYSASGNLIENNMINASGGYGMMLGTSSKSNVIRDNYIGNSTYYGIYVQDTTTLNRIYNNSFYFNHGSNATYNASHVQAYDASGTNFWNTTAPTGGHGYGNFWYDWQGPDSNNDGIVDEPYRLDGGAGAQDYYPLTSSSAVPELSWPVLVFAVLLGVALLRRHRD